MLHIALIGLIVDLYYTYISYIISPELFAILETNPFLNTPQWWLIVVYNVMWFALLWHALKIRSKFYILIYSGVLVGLRAFAVLSHPVFWMSLIWPNILVQCMGWMLQVIGAIVVWILVYVHTIRRLDE